MEDGLREFETIEAGHASGASASLDEIHELLRDATTDEPSLTLLRGFKLDFSGNRDFHKVFFSVRCGCGTAALLSVEVSKSKTRFQVQEALPSLLQHLRNRARQFNGMSCEAHERMRSGGMVQPPV